jgi:hypothetical protein
VIGVAQRGYYFVLINYHLICYDGDFHFSPGCRALAVASAGISIGAPALVVNIKMLTCCGSQSGAGGLQNFGARKKI